jgi:hypothetical protein
MFRKRPLLLCETEEEHRLELLRLFGTPDEEFWEHCSSNKIKEWIRTQPNFPPAVGLNFCQPICSLMTRKVTARLVSEFLDFKIVSKAV